MTNIRGYSGWRRWLLPIAWSRPGSWLYVHSLQYADRALLRWTGGRRSITSLLSGLPIITLTTIGAKSGLARTAPLLAIEDSPRLIIIASNFGQTHYPAWYHNLRAHPQVTVVLRGQAGAYTAHEAQGDERDIYWDAAVRLYPGYQVYKTRTGGRPIPVIVLTPTAS